MADNYIEFSEILTISWEEKVWAQEFLSIPGKVEALTNEEFESEKNEKLVKSWKAIQEEFYIEEPGHGFEFEANFDRSTVTDSEEGPGDSYTLWVYSDDCGNPSHAATFIQKLFQQFPENRKGQVFTLTWSESCSKPRVSEFGGGALAVTIEDYQSFDTHSWVTEQLSKMTKE